MTPEQQQIAIAQSRGWKFSGHPVADAIMKDWEFAYTFAISPETGQPETRDSIPDYLNDLNAMNEAIGILCKKHNLRCFCNSGLDGTWECVLTESDRPNCIPCDGDHYGASNTLCGAMAEAFLRTIGKWVE